MVSDEKALIAKARDQATARPAAQMYAAPTSVAQQREIAEVQASIMLARANPRDRIRVVDEIKNECTRLSLAEQALYSYSRGGQEISGPSIRLAEVIAQRWGNIQYGIRELDQQGGFSTVQAYAWDLETGTRREVTFQVQLVRHTKKGSYTLEDPRDIYETVANMGARRLRSCILGVIPGDVVEAAVAQCEETMRTKADVSPEAMKRMLAAFEAFGVTKEQIEKRIQRRIDSIQSAQVVALKKIYASLRDGMSRPEDWFDAVPAANGESGQAASAKSPAAAVLGAIRKGAAAGQKQKEVPGQSNEGQSKETEAVEETGDQDGDER